jgi:hypothetical protein
MTLHEDYRRLGEATDALCQEIVLALRLEQMVRWLNERLTRP